RAAEKLKELQIDFDMIGPSHGIIWRGNPKKIVDAYLRWSSGAAEDKAVVVYDTMWGSTEKMAKAIAEGIAQSGIKVGIYSLRKSDQSEIMKEILLSRAVLVGSPTLNNGVFPPIAGFLTYMKGLKPRNKVGAAFGSYGWGRGAVAATEKELTAMGFALEPSLEVQYRPNEEELVKCRALGMAIASKLKMPK
ncbi:MAG TPA: flavodoxin domain-containing protein, partial [Candidatus Bathyarchaeia archaeon]|nr:flavodoxin domain-containing protein [Candidatus Bathyarchaeia archaeon]